MKFPKRLLLLVFFLLLSPTLLLQANEFGFKLELITVPLNFEGYFDWQLWKNSGLEFAVGSLCEWYPNGRGFTWIIPEVNYYWLVSQKENFYIKRHIGVAYVYCPPEFRLDPSQIAGNGEVFLQTWKWDYVFELDKNSIFSFDWGFDFVIPWWPIPWPKIGFSWGYKF